MLDIHVVTLLLEQETLFNLHLERKFLNNAHGLDKVSIFKRNEMGTRSTYKQSNAHQKPMGQWCAKVM